MKLNYQTFAHKFLHGGMLLSTLYVARPLLQEFSGRIIQAYEDVVGFRSSLQLPEAIISLATLTSYSVVGIVLLVFSWVGTKELLNRILATSKAEDAVQYQQDVQRVVGWMGGGVHKRIDENRELLELLRNEAPDLVAKHPEIISWVQSHDDFLTKLAGTVGPTDAQFNPRTNFPRPWPGEDSESAMRRSSLSGS